MYSFTMKCHACSEPCSWSHKNSDYNLEFFCRNKHRNICTLLQFNEQKIPKLNEHKIKYDEYCSDCKENMCIHCDNKHTIILLMFETLIIKLNIILFESIKKS